MKNFRLYAILTVAGLMSPAVTLSGLAQAPSSNKPPPLSISSVLGDKVVARGKGFEVKQSEVDEMYITFKANRAALGQRVPDSARAKIESDMLEKIIATRLCLNRATDADREKGKETAARIIAEQMRQAPSEESFNRQLIAVGMTPEKFRAQITEQAIVNAVLDREIKVQKPVTEAAAREFYEKNPAYFQDAEMVRVSHILISTLDPANGFDLPPPKKVEKKQLAEKVLARARAGEDFGALVREFSDDVTTKAIEGDYTLFRGAEDRLRSAVPEFEAAAFSLKTNQISDLVLSRFGYHIIKLKERTPPRLKDFAKVEERIRDTLMKEQVQKELPAYLEKLKKEAGVEILVEKSGS